MSNKEKVPCPHCDKFYTARGLKTHITRMHKNIEKKEFHPIGDDEIDYLVENLSPPVAPTDGPGSQLRFWTEEGKQAPKKKNPTRAVQPKPELTEDDILDLDNTAIHDTILVDATITKPTNESKHIVLQHKIPEHHKAIIDNDIITGKPVTKYVRMSLWERFLSRSKSIWRKLFDKTITVKYDEQ